VLNQLPHHEDISYAWVTGTHIFILGTGWRWVE